VSYLFDTNVCIALINGTSPRIRQRYIQPQFAKSSRKFLPSFVHELWYGVAKAVASLRMQTG